MWNIRRLVSKGDYIYAVVPEHPFCTKSGYVLEHRIVIENSLGRLLMQNEVVHHINGNKRDNSLANLAIATNADHAREHAISRGRMWVDLKCPMCGILFSRAKSNTILSKPGKYNTCTSECGGKFSREVQLHGLTAEMKLAISENVVRVYRKYPHDNAEQTVDTGCVETIRRPPEMVMT